MLTPTLNTDKKSETMAPRIQLAVSAIVQRDDKILLAQRGNPPDLARWAFPGGRVEPGETTRNAVLRELAEETGLAGQVEAVFDVYDFVAPASDTSLPHHFTLIVYHVSVTSFDAMAAASDAAALGWFTRQQALQLSMPDSMVDAIKRL
ncbi:MAG: NUDIX domain-containing protein [Ahrensia sp.]